MTARLLRALRRSAEDHGASVMLESLSEIPWESATFSGSIHRIAVNATASPTFDAWLAALPEIDLPMPGQFVAEIVIADRTGGDAAMTVHVILE